MASKRKLRQRLWRRDMRIAELEAEVARLNRRLAEIDRSIDQVIASTRETLRRVAKPPGA